MKEPTRAGAIAFSLLTALSISGAAHGDASSIGQWSEVQDWPIQAIHAIQLPTGKVMVWQSWQTSAAIWDPATGDFEDSQFPSVNIFCSGHT